MRKLYNHKQKHLNNLIVCLSSLILLFLLNVFEPIFHKGRSRKDNLPPHYSIVDRKTPKDDTRYNVAQLKSFEKMIILVSYSDVRIFMLVVEFLFIF